MIKFILSLFFTTICFSAFANSTSVTCTATGTDTVSSTCNASGTITGNPGDNVSVTLTCQPATKTLIPSVEICNATGVIPLLAADAFDVLVGPPNPASGTVTISGDSGSQWINIGAWNHNTGIKVAMDFQPGTTNKWSLNIDTTKFSNALGSVDVVAFNVPPGQSPFIDKVLNVPITVNNTVTPPPPPPGGTFTIGNYTFSNTAPFEDDFTTLDIAGDVKTASSQYHFYANGERGNNGTNLYGLTGICCAIYKAPDDSTYNPYSLIPGGGVAIKIHCVPGASGGQAGCWRSGAFQTLAPDGTGFKQQYGYWEATIKNPHYPAGQMGPSFPSWWMLTAPGQGTPTDETDIYEIYGGCGPTPYNQAVQTTLYWQHNPDGANSSSTVNLGTDLSAGYHTYGLLWDANNVSFYFDHVLKSTAITPSFMKSALYAILDLDLYPTGCTTGPTSLMEGAELDIKSIKIWPLPK